LRTTDEQLEESKEGEATENDKGAIGKRNRTDYRKTELPPTEKQ